MAPNDSDSNQRAPITQAALVVGGFISLIVGVAVGPPGGGSVRDAIWGAGLFVFAGLCFVAAAIREAVAKLRKDD